MLQSVPLKLDYGKLTVSICGCILCLTKSSIVEHFTYLPFSTDVNSSPVNILNTFCTFLIISIRYISFGNNKELNYGIKINYILEL